MLNRIFSIIHGNNTVGKLMKKCVPLRAFSRLIASADKPCNLNFATSNITLAKYAIANAVNVIYGNLLSSHLDLLGIW